MRRSPLIGFRAADVVHTPPMVSRKVPMPLLAAATATVTATAVLPGLLLSPASAAVQAFPGAEGFGTETPGGRGGTVCQVTNLGDSGPGSLRSCVEASGPRYVVFKTGGTISLKNRLTVTNPNLTIAGQTAPGGGITLRMDPSSGTDQGTMQIATHDVVVRYVRFRPGNGGGADDSHDAITIYKAGVKNVVIDHCSFSWAIDENVNTYDESTDITISNSIIAEGLSNAGHPTGEHSKGLLAGGVNAHNVSIHHNLFVSNMDRNPQISGLSVADVRNNVVYNYGDGSGSGVTLISSSKGEPRVNWVGNYYKPGPNSDPNRAEFATYNGSTGATHQWYGDGNMRWTAGGDQPARISSDAVRGGTCHHDLGRRGLRAGSGRRRRVASPRRRRRAARPGGAHRHRLDQGRDRRLPGAGRGGRSRRLRQRRHARLVRGLARHQPERAGRCRRRER